MALLCLSLLKRSSYHIKMNQSSLSLQSSFCLDSETPKVNLLVQIALLFTGELQLETAQSLLSVAYLTKMIKRRKQICDFTHSPIKITSTAITVYLLLNFKNFQFILTHLTNIGTVYAKSSHINVGSNIKFKYYNNITYTIQKNIGPIVFIYTIMSTPSFHEFFYPTHCKIFAFLSYVYIFLQNAF